MINRMYPWSIQFDGVGHFSVSNDLSGNVKFGLRYAPYIHELVPGNYTISQVFFARSNGMKYYLVLSKDSLASSQPLISHTTSYDTQVVFVQYAQGVMCSHQTLECDVGIRLEQVWLFLNKGAPIPGNLIQDANDKNKRTGSNKKPPSTVNNQPSNPQGPNGGVKIANGSNAPSKNANKNNKPPQNKQTSNTPQGGNGGVKLPGM